MWNSHDILEQFQIEIVPKIDTREYQKSDLSLWGID